MHKVQELFDEHQDEPKEAADFFTMDLGEGLEPPPSLNKLYELSIDAYYSAVYARMSELPIAAEISRFMVKVGKCRDRNEAAKAASDRGDPDVLAVLKAAGKAGHEAHRLMGLLRFTEEDGRYTARCSPDHFILPALADHFTLRFGETPWAIIDEKRGVCLCREPGGKARLVKHSRNEGENQEAAGSWEDLWRLYFRSVNNEGRKNPTLQRQLMPVRYHKYLTEMQPGGKM